MDTAELSELKIKADIKHAFEMYVSDELLSEDEVEEGLGVIAGLSQQFRHIHVDLHSTFGDEYNVKYPEFDKVLDELTNFTKSLKIKLRALKLEGKESKAKDERFCVQEKEKEELKVEEEFLDLKIQQFSDMVDLDIVKNSHEIDDYIDKMEVFINEYFDLSRKAKCCLGKEYDQSYDCKFKKAITDMRQNVKMAKILKQKLFEVCEKNKMEAVTRYERSSQIVKAENLLSEIKFRCDSLESKYVREFKDLSDYQILEISQNKNLDLEFNGILERVTSLASLVPTGGEDVLQMLNSAVAIREVLAKRKETFQKILQKMVAERDITPEKMKNATSFKIELQKFNGYEGKIDFYTFKSQFQKLIEPNVRKQYLADYLKCNYLSGPALILVEKETEYNKIWERLFESFGNARLLLQNKLSAVDKVGGLWKIKGNGKLANAIAGLINAMTDLSSLASEHNIEGQLYEGGGLEKILILIGDQRHKKFRSKNLCYSESKKDEWGKLLQFLKDELRLLEKLAFDNKTAQLMGLCPSNSVTSKSSSSKEETSKKWAEVNHVMANESSTCSVCDKEGHTVITTAKGNKIIPYYVCEDFVKMTPSERLSKLKSKNLCTKCLYPGAVKGPKHKCFFTYYCCPHRSHEDGEKCHILLCDAHKNDEKNIKLLEKFKKKFVENCNVPLPQFSKNLSFFSGTVGVAEAIEGNVGSYGTFRGGEPDVTDSAIFHLQTIEVEGIKLNIFFDDGCGDMIVSKSAIEKLISIGRAKQVIPGPITMTGVGDQKTVCKDGVYSISLPLYNEKKNSQQKNAVLTGVCMLKITAEFPVYDLNEVGKDIHNECKKIGGQDLVNRLPKLPKNVGGETHILVGSRYKKYFPKTIFELESGLGISESVFQSPCGARGVLCGPHKVFSKVEKNFKGLYVDSAAYCGQSLVSWDREFCKLQNEIPLLGIKVTPSMSDIAEMPEFMECFQVKLPDLSCEGTRDNVCIAKRSPKCVKQFDRIENAGTDITFRCVDCMDCIKCKNSTRLDAISIQEEIEQGLIERCVHVDVSRGVTTAKLPFITDPDTRLKPNENEALKVFRAQLRKLNANPKDKQAVIESEGKLQSLGFVDFFHNLDDDDKKLILASLVKYFIPWRAVWNEKSLSTPCRLVFDASQGTREGCSINSLLAKGANSMNKLVEILIRWTACKHAFHSDIQKMYNSVRLDKRFWRYQLYLWSDGLEENSIPEWKVIKTLIYGVRSSGNLAECALRRTAEICKDEFPRVYGVVTRDTYVDDMLSGTESSEKTLSVTDDLEAVVLKGGFRLKGFTISGQDPSGNLSSDGESVVVAGMRWFPKGDFIRLNISELNFNKKLRGRKAEADIGIIPQTFTKRDCVSRVSEIFDPLGKVAPILAGMKLDISGLHQRRLDWDDPIPSDLKNVWVANFDVIRELRNIEFHRAVIPEDAVNLNVETIEVADAGENLICAAVYARYKRKNGEYSCQLIFARTKVVHDITIPRAELAAAGLNVSTGHIVSMSLQKFHKHRWKLTDSQVVLHWINSTKSVLKGYVRTRVLEITRITDRSEWYYVGSKDNVADLGTRKGAKVADVGPMSPWIQGLPWMKGEDANFPLKTVEEIVMCSKEKSDASKEKMLQEHLPFSDENFSHVTKFVPNEVGDRFKFSKYVINPNKFRFRNVVRILGLVFLFIQKMNSKCNKNRCFGFLKKRQFSQDSVLAVSNNGEYIVSPLSINTQAHATTTEVVVIELSEDLLNAARGYFFQKAGEEVRHFVDPSKYKNDSVWKDGILYYTGRILSTQDIVGQHSLGDVSLDLTASTFCVPITDAHSPIAYAIVSEVHWYNPDVKHKGVETVLRYCQNTAHIIGGRTLVKSIKRDCITCRILQKKKVRAAMGSVGENNLTVAPPFYLCQADICGPFSAYSPVNKRATLKIWLVVFCCTVTGAVDSRVMENYTADAFILAFIRFASRFGYPKTVMPDEGSQLVKGCQDMIISYSDVKHKMSVEYGVDFRTCPVGAHYVHGKVERKIQEIKRSLKKINKSRLSVLQWETLIQQICNSINNMPIGLGNKTEFLENLDILTPNRLILGRNNSRTPTAPLQLSNDFRRIIENNNEIFSTWFKEWLVSYVPTLIEKPKWFTTERNVSVGDIILFLKSEQEFDQQYQYGIVVHAIVGRDSVVRVVTIEYKNHSENFKRTTKRGVRDLVVIHPVEEIGISKELQEFAEISEK